MRDLLLLIAMVGVAPLIVRSPIVGLLAWIWIALMNPQREVYGFLSGFNLNSYIAALTLLAWMASKMRRPVSAVIRRDQHGELARGRLAWPDLFTCGIVLFAAWATLTTATALDRSFSYAIWDRTTKTLVLVLAVAMLVNTKARIQAVVWMLAISLGYYAVKGGGFVLLTGGRQLVYGPADSMIGDNNTLGLALIILLPLINYLRTTSRMFVTRLACLATIALTFLALIGTYSRGALVALAAAGAIYALKSRSGIVLLLVAGMLALAAPKVLPDSWLERMSTINAYNEDASFQGRVEAWKASVAIATARPLLGGGFSALNTDQVARKFSDGRLKAGKAAHSIYFEVLGDHGFVGLALYLLILASAVLNIAMVLHKTRGVADLAWANALARMLQVSLVAFLVGGAALSMAYYDGALLVLALPSALLRIVSQSASQTQTATPRWKALPSEPVDTNLDAPTWPDLSPSGAPGGITRRRTVQT